MKVVLTDFDGTITSKEKLPADFFKLIDLCKKYHLKLVIVSARPASWGSFLLNYFDIDACIMEDGAIYLSKNDTGEIIRNLLTDPAYLLKTIKLREELVAIGESLSNDCLDRTLSVAIKKASSSRNLSDTLKAQGEAFGFTKYETDKNIYFTPLSVSKIRGIRLYLNDIGTSEDESIFFGDSINDICVFKELKNTVGVSNLQLHHFKEKDLPKIMLQGEHNSSVWGIYNYLKELMASE